MPKIKRIIILLLINTLFISSLFSQNSTGDELAGENILLKNARNAFRNYEPVLAIPYLQKLWDDPAASLQNRVKAGTYLADLQAKIYNDFEKAKIIMIKVISFDQGDFNAHLKFSQIADEFQQRVLAIENGQKAITLARSKEEKVIAYSSFGKILLHFSIKQILEGPPVNQMQDLKLNRDLITNTIMHLNRVINIDPYQLEILKTKFALEILLGKKSDAMETWQKYFNYSEHSNQALKRAFDLLQNRLNKWNDRDASLEQKKLLSLTFATARDFDLAMVVIKTIPANQIEADSKLKEIVNYYDFLGNVKSFTRSFYQKTAIGKADPKVYRDTMVSHVKTLWENFSWDGDKKDFSLNNFEYEIDKRFGASVRIGNANGWFSITWGHKVFEHEGSIEQYGIKTAIITRSLDYLISNGYRGWYNNNSGIIGGWQSDNIVYQVRPVYLTGPYNAWINISDSVKLSDWKKNIAAGIEKDKLFAKNDETVIFPGMLAKITYKSRLDLFNDLINKGLSGEALKNRFMSEYETLSFENSITAHEGRHLIDHQIAKEKALTLTPEELEFRAKLSEIAFAKYPFMALASILAHGIGSSPHGIANKRLITGLYHWIETNGNKVEGIRTDLPKGAQLDLLTNEQLIAAVRSMDPLVPTK